MPEYSFINVKTNVHSDFFFSMKDVPSVGAEVLIEGAKWKRVFTSPRAAKDTAADPYSVSDFNKTLDGKNVTVGDMWTHSAEMSERRAAKEGRDPVKDKYLARYKKTHQGQEHPHQKRERFAALQKQLGINLGLRSQ